ERESLIHELFLTWGVEGLLPLVKLLHHIGEIASEGIQDAVHIPEKDAGIPHELTTLQKLFGQFQVGFFSECFHLTNPFAVAAINLYISIACLGATGPDAKREEHRVLFNECKSATHIGGEEVFTQNKVIG